MAEQTQVKFSIPLPKPIHSAAKMEAARTGIRLQELLAAVLLGTAEPSKTFARSSPGTNGDTAAALVRPSVFLPGAAAVKAQRLAEIAEVSLTVLLSRRIIEHFSR